MLDLSLYLTALNSTNDGLIISENRGSENPIIYANPAFLALSGYTLEEVLGKDCRFLQGAEIDQTVIDSIRNAIETGIGTVVTLRNFRKDGTLFWNELSISPIKDENETVTHFVGIQKDVTEQVELKNKLQQQNLELQQLNHSLKEQNQIDHLTQLYNRKVLTDKVELLWNTAKRSQSRFSIFFIDVDHFKSINDSFGHVAGDECLAQISNILKSHFKRPTDVLVRYGGEEFMVVTFAFETSESIEIAEQIRNQIEQLIFNIPAINRPVNLTVSIGIYCSIPQPNEQLKDAIHHADQAMYQAKALGRNQVYIQCGCCSS